MRTIVGKVEDWARAGAETLVAIADLMITGRMLGEKRKVQAHAEAGDSL